MNRPNLPTELTDVLAADHVELFMLVKLEFDAGNVYISGADFDVEYDGEIWTSLRGLGSVDPIVESGDEIPGINLTLSGVPAEAIIHAQTEAYRGRKVTIKWAFFDGDVLRVDTAAWQGFIDTPIITRESDTCTIQVSAENRMIDWQRPRGLLFNHADQQRIDPTDTFFHGIESMVEREVVLFLPQAYGGYGGGSFAGPSDSDLVPDTAPDGQEYNIDIMNGFRQYYNRNPSYEQYNAYAQSGMYGSALMIDILYASRGGGPDYDMAVSRGYDPNNPSAHYYPSVLHPPGGGGGDWNTDWSGGE